MDNDVKEIAYNLLQQEYLKRRHVSTSEENIKEIVNYFPEDWFILYTLDERIKIISSALKDNIDIREVKLEKKQIIN